MPSSSEEPWSTNPNAPKIPYWVYLGEKENFAGILIGAIFYGIVIDLFFRCVGSLLSPLNRTKRGVKLGLAVHTVAMFSFVTIYQATSLYLQSISYIDNREFPGGPLLYQLSISTRAISVLPNIMFPLNQWLADGLLLYRCYIIYGSNYWVIAFPGLMLIATAAMGIMFIYEILQPAYVTSQNSVGVNVGLSFYSISFALNILLTLIIVARLVLHSRNIRNAMGSPATTRGLYRSIVTMLVESSAFYAVAFLLYIVPWSIKDGAQFIFFPILADAQVIGPFLITLRVAKQRALTSQAIVSGRLGSIRFGSQGMSTGAETLPEGDALNGIDPNEKAPGGLDSRAEAIDSHHSV